MAAGKRSGECCACHLLRWEPAAASPGGSALPPAPAPAAPEAPRPSGAPVWAAASAPRGEIPSPARGDAGRSPKRSVVGVVAGFPRTLWAQRGWHCIRLLGGCSLLGRLGLASG